jgi:adenylate cyclase
MITVKILENGQLLYEQELDEPLELGRQRALDEPMFVRQKLGDKSRVAVARLSENRISREQVRIESNAADRVSIRNISSNNSLYLYSGSTLAGLHKRELFLPTDFKIGSKTVVMEVQDSTDGQQDLHSLMAPTMTPGDMLMARRVITSEALSWLPEEHTEKLLNWLQAVTSVLQSAAGSNDFFAQAAQSLVDLVRLDCGRVLLLEGGQWNVVALRAAPGLGQSADEWTTSRRLLNRVCREKQTCWLTPDLSMQSGASLAEVQAVVVAPICDHTGRVIGALYGDRLLRSIGGSAGQISKPEAMLVQVLASGVAAGLARMEQERVAVESRVRFEQFFSPELSRQLADNPELLSGRDSNVTILVCDIRGFSRITERLGPAKTLEWINEVLSVLSDSAIGHGGVLVDFVGDELMAMWGAPQHQPDHAQRAVRAAAEMLRALPDLSRAWQSTLGEPVKVAIGINSGVARVGNTGSRRKFKYGPLGNTVNLASRVQGATKFLKTDMLVTAATRQELPAETPARRLCTVRVVNIQGAVDLYEIRPDPDSTWPALCRAYEEALARFEQRDFHQATRILGNILADHPQDGPSLVLLSRAVGELIRPAEPFDPVWELSGK